MRRGAELENHINRLLNELELLGIHGHKNNAFRTVTGKTLKGEAFDYEIFFPGEVHLFDAKECSAKNLHWPLSEFKAAGSRMSRQLEALLMCSKNPNVKAYFLVWFKSSGQYVSYTPQTVCRLLFEGRNYLLPLHGEKWLLPLE